MSQTVLIQGQIESANEVENIHVINKTEQKFTITNSKGEFEISAKVNDTLIVSSIQNKLKTVVIEIKHVLTKKIAITLEEQINQLDEVVLGNMLTGDLLQDMENVEGEPVTAKSLGIPSYQGPRMTQSERRLYDADRGKMIPSFGLATAVNLHKLLNTISGRTKKLKTIVKLEREEVLMYQIKARLSEDLFTDNALHEDYIIDYFHFVSDDENFTAICKHKSDLEILVFLNKKLNQYKANQELKEN